jgi:hypothetical protein
MSATRLRQARTAARRPAPAALQPLITRPLVVRFTTVAGGALTTLLRPPRRLRRGQRDLERRLGAGMGAGAAVIGLLAATAGYPAAFVITAAMVLPALAPVLRERSRAAHAAAPGRAELSSTG